MAKLAVIDIGTNSIHMVLAEIESDGTYKILDRFKDMTRLGDGTFEEDRLSDEVISRGLHVLRNLTMLAKNKGYDRVVMGATSAIREAKNGGDFVEQVAKATGVRIRVITGNEEARLIYLGVRQRIDLSDKPSLIVDVGGGSVEVIAGNRDQVFHAVSLKLGSIRMKDQYLKKAPPSKKAYHNMQELIKDQISSTLKYFGVTEFDRVIASSGMAGNLAEIAYLQRTGRPIPQVNMATVSLKEMRTIEQSLVSKDLEARLQIPGLEPRRVDTLLSAICVMRQVVELSGQKGLTVSDHAIREGLIYDFVKRNKERLRVEHEIPNIRLRHVVGLARRCRYPQKHSHHVAKLALSIFEQTHSLHKLGEREKEWLEYAAILHDIGYLISQKAHHKHTYYLIKNSSLAGLTAAEIEMIANVARYHRGPGPSRRHESYQQVPETDQQTVKVLGAILRVADGLDRSHFAVVQRVSISLGASITIQVVCAGDSAFEIWTAKSRIRLFEKVMKRKVRFEVTEDASLVRAQGQAMFTKMLSWATRPFGRRGVKRSGTIAQGQEVPSDRS